jgi:hypothetical protein
MERRLSRYIGLPEESNELTGLQHNSALDLAAQFLEVKRLRRELRIAQCGRVAHWAGQKLSYAKQSLSRTQSRDEL